MIPYSATPSALKIASAYWSRSWWELSVDMVEEALEPDLWEHAAEDYKWHREGEIMDEYRSAGDLP